LDTIPPREFMDIYERVCFYVDLKGCKTREDVEERMLDAIRVMRRGASYAKYETTSKRWFKRAKALETLIKEGNNVK
jgi:hypothetical protein